MIVATHWFHTAMNGSTTEYGKSENAEKKISTSIEDGVVRKGGSTVHLVEKSWKTAKVHLFYPSRSTRETVKAGQKPSHTLPG